MYFVSVYFVAYCYLPICTNHTATRNDMNLDTVGHCRTIYLWEYFYTTAQRRSRLQQVAALMLCVSELTRQSGSR